MRRHAGPARAGPDPLPTAYVRRTSQEGVAEAEAALRLLEVRVGQLLPR